MLGDVSSRQMPVFGRQTADLSHNGSARRCKAARNCGDSSVLRLLQVFNALLLAAI